MATSTHDLDWPGRYHHIDQILDAPGPRTDPQFSAGKDVCIAFHHTNPNSPLNRGQRLS